MKGNKLKSKIEKKFNSTEYKISLVPTKSPRDHYMYDLFLKGKKISIFQISFGSKEFGKELIARMARQLGISSNQLIGIEKCTFWAKDFVINSKLVILNS